MLSLEAMRRSLRVVLVTAGAAALLCAPSRAHADTQGTPNQPPEMLAPVEPPPAAAAPATPPPSQAQPVPTYARYQQRRRHEDTRWYGWQNLIVDGGVIVGGLALSAATAEAGGVVLVTGYFFGGPIVHWSHGQVGRGFASLGIRVAAPLLFAGLGYAVFQRDGSGADLRGLAGAILGFGLGVVSAIVVDAAALAYEKVDEDDDDARALTRRRQAQRPIVTWSPWAAPRTEGGGMIGLSGTL